MRACQQYACITVVQTPGQWHSRIAASVARTAILVVDISGWVAVSTTFSQAMHPSSPSSNASLPKRSLVSVIMPMHNASAFLDDALKSVRRQTYRPLELSIYNDASTDDSVAVVQRWIPVLQEAGVDVVLTHPASPSPKKAHTDQKDGKSGEMCATNDHCRQEPGGVGFAKNRAVESSHGAALCFLDADDMMMPERVAKQLDMLQRHPDAIVGCKFCREPTDSTPYYTAWINGLSEEQMVLQQYRECTIIMPTWFMSRATFDRVGGFEEGQKRCPEDLIFFNKHLDLGGGIARVNDTLLVYRFVAGSASHLIEKRALQRTRIPFFEHRVLSRWPQITLWGAGKDGKRFLNDLSPEIAAKVVAFCDVDVKKIGTTYHFIKQNRHVPIVHYSQAKPPCVICVGSKIFDGVLEKNIASTGFVEGVDYYHFM